MLEAQTGNEKKVSTAAVKPIRNSSQPKLTIGLDLGDRSSWYCLLDEEGEVLQEQTGHDSESDARGVRKHAALSDRAGDRDAFERILSVIGIFRQLAERRISVCHETLVDSLWLSLPAIGLLRT